MSTNGEGVEPQMLREVLASFPTGVTIVTSADTDGTPRGTTVSAFASVCLDPPLVLISLANQSRTLAAISSLRVFGVHILGADHLTEAQRFAKDAPDKFNGIEHTFHERGIPLLSHCAGHLVCTVAAEYPGGDHVLLLGQVVEARSRTTTDPMVYHQRVFKAVGEHLSGQE